MGINLHFDTTCRRQNAWLHNLIPFHENGVLTKMGFWTYQCCLGYNECFEMLSSVSYSAYVCERCSMTCVIILLKFTSFSGALRFHVAGTALHCSTYAVKDLSTLLGLVLRSSNHVPRTHEGMMPYPQSASSCKRCISVWFEGSFITCHW